MDYKTIWDTLSRVDISKHIEKKGGLSYLSWMGAWETMMQYYPQATYEFGATQYEEDNSATVWCTVTIDECSRAMWLPVMDHRNNAIQAPNARQISDTRMRCLVKCIAMFGLGYYVYMGDDEPKAEPKKETPWIQTEEGQAEYERAINLSIQLKDLIGAEEARKTIDAYRGNSILFDVEYTSLKDIRMKKEDLERICELIQNKIHENDVEHHQETLAGMPD